MYVNAGCVHQAAARWRANGHVLSNPAHASAFTHKNRKKRHSRKRTHSYHIFISIYTDKERDFIAVQRMSCQQNTNAQARRVCLCNIQVREPYSEQGPAVPKAGKWAARLGEDQE